MRVISIILFIIGAVLLLISIGSPIAMAVMGELPGDKMIWTAIGGVVMGVLFIQGGRSFWDNAD